MVALHVEHRHAAGGGHVADVAIAEAPIALADGDAVVVAAENLADLLGRVAVADLGGGAVDELRVPAQLGHAGLKAVARARAGEEEQHRQHLVAQVGVGIAERPLALQIQGHIEDGVDLVFGPLLGGDHVACREDVFAWGAPAFVSMSLYSNVPSRIGDLLDRSRSGSGAAHCIEPDHGRLAYYDHLSVFLTWPAAAHKISSPRPHPAAVRAR